MFEIFNVTINPFGIALAAGAYFIFTIWWHSNFGLGKIISKYSIQNSLLKISLVNLVASLIVAFLIATGLNSIIQYSAMLSGLNQWTNIIATAFMSATTISASTLLASFVWENKSKKLILLNYLETLIGYILVCTVLSFFFTV